jgi:hypothetical protein
VTPRTIVNLTVSPTGMKNIAEVSAYMGIPYIQKGMKNFRKLMLSFIHVLCATKDISNNMLIECFYIKIKNETTWIV